MTRATAELRLGDDFALPVDAVTETFAILAKRGRGKTVTASVLTEELIGAGLPVCVLDPTGAWWGLRSSADGTQPGLPVVIFGGEHADVPLDETAGALLAEIIVEQRFPAVVDLSLLSKSGARRFVTDFAETLYRRNREPLHLIIDECDLFCPQRTFAGTERLVGAMDDIVRRGRIRGLGVTLISQRPAVVNKDVLSQVECLIVLGMTGRHDIEAIDEWVRLHADERDARQVKATLPSMPVGTAWIWSPEWLSVLQQVKIRMRRTFDSSATPRAGVRRVVPEQWATVDLGALSQRLTAPDDPAASAPPAGAMALRRRIVELERALAAKPAPTVQTVEVPVLTSDATELLREAVALYEAAALRLAELLAPIAAAVSTSPAPAPSPPPTTTSRPPRPARRPPATASDSTVHLARVERAILTVLARHGRRTTTQVALLAGYSHKSGGYRNGLSSLRSAGYIEGRGDIEATTTGVTALGAFEPLPRGRALLDWWYSKLGKAERAILAVVVDAWPAELAVEEIATRTGYQSTSGGFRNALSRLRSFELASGRGALRVADVLGEANRG